VEPWLVNDQLLDGSYQLAKEFGWTPVDIQNLTMAQMNVFLQKINQHGKKGS